MNLLKLFKSLLIVIFLIAAVAVAQEDLLSVVKIEGKTCIASSQEEFETLTALVELINTMRQAKANGTIDSTYYSEKVASYMKDARTSGIRMKKNN